jgi:hypothetical protein
MEKIIRISLSIVIALTVYSFVKITQDGVNFKKGLESHLLNNSWLHHNIKNVCDEESTIISQECHI